MHVIKKITLSAILALLIAAPTFGQWNESGTLTINGNMPLITELRIVDENVQLTLAESVSDVLLATIFERSNSQTGYTVSLSSANNGILEHEAGQGSLIYELTYGGSQVDLSGGAVNVTTNGDRTPAQGLERELLLSHSGGGVEGDFLPEGSYIDTLTFEISAQ
ncbi:hypothetical protein [Spirochaeta dissipatitropha]